MTQYTEQVPATSDANGNITWTLPNPPPETVLTGSVSVPTAPSGAMFHATAADTDWGTWAGPAHQAPMQTNPQIPITVTGTGLLPKTMYVLTFNSTQQPRGTEPPVWPVTSLTTPFATSTLQDGNVTIPASGVATFGPYPTQGFASLRITANNPDNLLQFNIAVTWADAKGNTSGDQEFALAGFQGSIAQTEQPHKGDFVTIQVQNAGGHSGSPFVYLANTTELAAYWVGDSFSEGTVWESLPVPAGATSTLLTPSHIYGGPATMFINPGGAATWSARLFALLLTGTSAQIYRWSNADIATGANVIENVIVPPAPLHLDFTNGTGGSVTPVVGLYCDTWRAG